MISQMPTKDLDDEIAKGKKQKELSEEELRNSMMKESLYKQQNDSDALRDQVIGEQRKLKQDLEEPIDDAGKRDMPQGAPGTPALNLYGTEITIKEGCDAQPGAEWKAGACLVAGPAHPENPRELSLAGDIRSLEDALRKGTGSRSRPEIRQQLRELYEQLLRQQDKLIQRYTERRKTLLDQVKTAEGRIRDAFRSSGGGLKELAGHLSKDLERQKETIGDDDTSSPKAKSVGTLASLESVVRREVEAYKEKNFVDAARLDEERKQDFESWLKSNDDLMRFNAAEGNKVSTSAAVLSERQRTKALNETIANNQRIIAESETEKVHSQKDATAEAEKMAAETVARQETLSKLTSLGKGTKQAGVGAFCAFLLLGVSANRSSAWAPALGCARSTARRKRPYSSRSPVVHHRRAGAHRVYRSPAESTCAQKKRSTSTTSVIDCCDFI